MSGLSMINAKISKLKRELSELYKQRDAIIIKQRIDDDYYKDIQEDINIYISGLSIEIEKNGCIHIAL